MLIDNGNSGTQPVVIGFDFLVSLFEEFDFVELFASFE